MGVRPDAGRSGGPVPVTFRRGLTENIARPAEEFLDRDPRTSRHPDSLDRCSTHRPPAPFGAFALAAVLYARQLADELVDLARLLLGADTQVIQLIEAATPPQLAGCALRGDPPLHARLAQHPNFWTDIVDFVRDGTRERQLAAHTRGVQHSAFRR